MRRITLCVLAALAIAATGCSPLSRKEAADSEKTEGPQSAEMNVETGGRKVVKLSVPNPGQTDHAQMLSAEILPGRGMNIYQITAYLPGKGTVNMLASPSLEEGANVLNGETDSDGILSYSFGGAVLVPFANRIRGKVSADGKTITTTILGKTVTLDANSKGKKPGAIPHAMHGLILKSPMDSGKESTSNDSASVTGNLDAGNFGGHWLSKTQLTIVDTLKPNSFGFTVTAKNVGNEDVPIGVGWHPYFAFPSGDREQVRLHIPATERALVNNYDDVFPTGKLVPVAKTPYDFTAPGGAPLGKLYLDDAFVDLQKDTQSHAAVEIIDPAAKYGVRITAISPEITAFQAYAPVNKEFVAIEPQFNWADPFSPVWKGQKTGMVVLKPGQSVTYSVQVEVFVP